MIQPALKQKYRETCALMTIPALEKAAENLAAYGKMEEARYIRDLIAERKAYRADISPVQRESRPAPAQAATAEPILSPAAYHALKQAGLVVVLSGAVLAGAYAAVAFVIEVAIPATIAFLTAIFPFIAAGLGMVATGWIIISSLRSKKNEYPQSSPSGHTYITNIFVGENGGVEVKQ